MDKVGPGQRLVGGEAAQAPGMARSLFPIMRGKAELDRIHPKLQIVVGHPIGGEQSLAFGERLWRMQ